MRIHEYKRDGIVVVEATDDNIEFVPGHGMPLSPVPDDFLEYWDIDTCERLVKRLQAQGLVTYEDYSRPDVNSLIATAIRQTIKYDVQRVLNVIKGVDFS